MTIAVDMGRKATKTSILISISHVILGNGPGSGGRISVYLSEVHHSQCTFTALGGSFTPVHGSEYRHGSPGTVYVHSTVGSDITTELRIDNAGRSYATVMIVPTQLQWMWTRSRISGYIEMPV